MKVGVPRALLYYQYYPMWRTFFEALGGEVLVSSPTTKATVAAGSEQVVAETCLPVKVYCGHVLELSSRVDRVFVPAVRSLEPRVLNCSKFLGLPDLIRAVLPQVPPLLDPEFDLDHKSSEDKEWLPPTSAEISLRARLAFYQALYRLGSAFTRDPRRIKAAAKQAWEVHQAYLRLMQEGLTPPEAIACWERRGSATGETDAADRDGQPSGALDPLAKSGPCPSGKPPGPREGEKGEQVIALIGHPYNLYDAYITHSLVSRLREMGVRLVTAEMATPEELRQGILDLTGQPYWTYEDEVVGAAGHYLRDEQVDGIIAVGSFGCGPDSTLLDAVRRAARERGRPFMSLVIDEHTGEAGLITRLEAFIDMLVRRTMRQR